MSHKSPKIEVCILGSGTGVPSPRRRPPALVLRSGGHVVLFDCGAGTLWSLATAGMDFRDLDWLWFSHFHPDHTGDLVPLLFAARSPLYGREKPLVIGGAVGLKDLYRRLRRVYGHWIELSAELLDLREIVPTAPAKLDLPIGNLVTMAMAHTPESLGYRLETEDGLVMAYSGDTDYCANAVELSRDADLFFCECSFPDHLKTEGHLSPHWAARVARESGCKRLVLLHLYPACDEIDVISACRHEYAGEIIVAEDLMWFRL
ncbi:MAG: MBL fold metallo-hydrolase [Deltaproteobacteria bacterium]|nr:MAG: MBL fold metallo-hydrolase [Deltaproteobacteria bacterium]